MTKASMPLAILALCLLAAPTSIWAASTTEAGNCDPSHPHYPTIQNAVDSSPANSTILVCPGVWAEQVVITKPLTLKGYNNPAVVTGSGATIVPPIGGMVVNGANLYPPYDPIAAQILVNSAGPVNITDLTVDGSNNGLTGCAPDFIGIAYQNASGTIQHAGVLNQILSADLLGCQTGLGIYVQSASPGVSAVTVINSVVQNYQKNGITANETGTTATITSNNVIGIGATPAIAQNGIQLGFGAQGSVTGNNVFDDVYTGPGYGAAGVLVYASQGVTINSNTIANTQYAVTVDSDPTYGTADNAIVNTNRISATRNLDAIDLCSNGNTAKNNVISSSDQSAIHLDSFCGGTGNNNTVTNNNINVACAGILADAGTSGNATSPNTFFNTPTPLLSANTCSPPPAGNKVSGKPSKRALKPAR